MFIKNQINPNGVLIIVFLILFFLFDFACTSCQDENKQQSIPQKHTADTSLIQNIPIKNSSFEILQISNLSGETKYLCYFTDQGYRKQFLFETIEEFKEENLIHLYKDYYGFPYFTGGNYCRAMGINVIRITDDTAVFLGPVSGYDDIDSNGTMELYIDVATDMTGPHGKHLIEKFEVDIAGDSLVYREIDLY